MTSILDPDQRWVRCSATPEHYNDDVGPYWPQKGSTTKCPRCGAPLDVGYYVRGQWEPEE